MLPDGGNLWLQVTLGQGGHVNKSWVFRFTVNEGRPREMGLGSLNTISLAQARGKALECRKLLQDHIDPIKHRDEARFAKRAAEARVKTFDECAAEYLAAHKSGWRSPKHAEQWLGSLTRYVSPKIGKMPVALIDKPMVISVLRPIWTAKPETAKRVRGRIEAVLHWAISNGYLTGDVNPAALKLIKGGLGRQTDTVAHLAALPFEQVPAFMADLRKHDSIPARAIEFAILTAARSGEVRSALWGEIDFEGRLWTIPPGHTKRQREHRVPLSRVALNLLHRQWEVRSNDKAVVFPGNRDRRLSDTWLLRLLNRLEYVDRQNQRITLHGFRSTFRDWVSECTNTPNEVAEQALAHAIPNAAEAAYRRGDLLERRRALMDGWAGYCTGSPADNIIPIASRS